MLLLYIVYCKQASYHTDKETTYARKLCCLTIASQLLEALVELLKPIDNRTAGFLWYHNGFMWLISENTTAGIFC